MGKTGRNLSASSDGFVKLMEGAELTPPAFPDCCLAPHSSEDLRAQKVCDKQRGSVLCLWVSSGLLKIGLFNVIL